MPPLYKITATRNRCRARFIKNTPDANIGRVCENRIEYGLP